MKHKQVQPKNMIKPRQIDKDTKAILEAIDEYMNSPEIRPHFWYFGIRYSISYGTCKSRPGEIYAHGRYDIDAKFRKEEKYIRIPVPLPCTKEDVITELKELIGHIIRLGTADIFYEQGFYE